MRCSFNNKIFYEISTNKRFPKSTKFGKSEYNSGIVSFIVEYCSSLILVMRWGKNTMVQQCYSRLLCNNLLNVGNIKSLYMVL